MQTPSNLFERGIDYRRFVLALQTAELEKRKERARRHLLRISPFSSIRPLDPVLRNDPEAPSKKLLLESLGWLLPEELNQLRSISHRNHPS